jgi:hypothetical protein
LMRARRGSGATAHGPRLLPGEAETMAGLAEEGIR